MKHLKKALRKLEKLQLSLQKEIRQHHMILPQKVWDDPCEAKHLNEDVQLLLRKHRDVDSLRANITIFIQEHTPPK